MTIDEILVGDDPEPWERLGFSVAGRVCRIGSVAVRLAGARPRGGIVEWSLTGVKTTELDGLPTRLSSSAQRAAVEAVEHPNGALRLDHLVVASDDVDRTVTELEGAGLSLRRRDDTPRRMAFFRLGEVILELVEGGEGRPRFWGLVVVVEDVDRLAAELGDRVGPVHAAVQPGRRIASLKPGSGVSPALAFMSP